MLLTCDRAFFFFEETAKTSSRKPYSAYHNRANLRTREDDLDHPPLLRSNASQPGNQEKKGQNLSFLHAIRQRNVSDPLLLGIGERGTA